jgi:hypothetical protein
MKEFYAPARHQMAIPPGIKGITGGIIFPAGINQHTLSRRDLSKKYPHLKRRLLDPQFYLSSLSAFTCRKACVNLSSYPWCLTNGAKAYESSKQSQSEWKAEANALIHRTWKSEIPKAISEINKVVAKCILFQEQLDCEAIILPCPLTIDFSSDIAVELAWLDVGLALAKQLAPNKPRLATIAISDSCLRSIDPWKNDLLTVIIDQITARTPEGAYIVIEQTNESAHYCANPNTIASLLRLVYELKEGGLQRIVVGLVGMAGLLAIAAGADAWTVGYYQSAQRVRLSDFDDHEGRAFPTYYTHKLAGEIHLENDLDKINEKGFLNRIEDVTPASKELIQALRSAKKVKNVPEWQYKQTNIAAANQHFLMVAARETQILAGKTKRECLQYAYDWLKSSEQLAVDLNSLGGFNPRTSLKHQASWLHSFESFIQATGAL